MFVLTEELLLLLVPIKQPHAVKNWTNQINLKRALEKDCYMFRRMSVCHTLTGCALSTGGPGKGRVDDQDTKIPVDFVFCGKEGSSKRMHSLSNANNVTIELRLAVYKSCLRQCIN